MDRKIQQGEEGPRSGTKKRCSHNLHGLVSGKLQYFSQRKYFRSEKRTRRESNSIIEKHHHASLFHSYVVFVLWF